MLKKYANTAFFYGVVGPLLGAFYREYTKFMNFSGKTALAVVHTHTITLGMLVFLIVLLLEKSFMISKQKLAKSFYISYNIGLLFLIGTLFARGVQQIVLPEPSRVFDMAMSGIAGIGHLILLVGIILLFLTIKGSLKDVKEA